MSLASIFKVAKVVPSLIKAGGDVWMRFKTLSIKGKVLTITITPASVWFMSWLIERYGMDTVLKAIDAITIIADELPIN